MANSPSAKEMNETFARSAAALYVVEVGQVQRMSTNSHDYRQQEERGSGMEC